MTAEVQGTHIISQLKLRKAVMNLNEDFFMGFLKQIQ